MVQQQSDNQIFLKFLKFRRFLDKKLYLLKTVANLDEGDC